MLLLRAILLLVFGLLTFAVLVMMVQSPTANLAADGVMLGLFVLIILVLGPWWPSPDNPGKWDWALEFDLPTDDPKIAAPLASLALGIYSLFHAWEHTQPNAKLHRFERMIGPWSSHEGIALAWVLIGIGCFVGAWQAFGRIPRKPKKVP